MDVPTLIRELLALSPEDRWRVLEAVNTAPVPDLASILTPDQLQELNRRLDLDDAGLLEGEPWEAVKARWRARS